MPTKRGPAPVPPHKPSPELKAAVKAWLDAVDAEEKTRHAARKAIADELKQNPDLPIAALGKSDAIPWDTEMIRRIAREYNVPYRQPNKAPVKQ